VGLMTSKGPSPVTTSDVRDDAPAARSTRRSLLGASAAGVALAALAARSVGASSGNGPTAVDRELLGFAMGLELAARDLYEAAVEAGADSPLVAAMASQHAAYAQSLGGLAGQSASSRNREAFDALESSFAVSDNQAVLEAAYELESIATATHTELLALIETANAARLVASILAVEARHCTVLADASGRGDDLDALLVNSADPILPEDNS
jgi:rubrerythrin